MFHFYLTTDTMDIKKLTIFCPFLFGVSYQITFSVYALGKQVDSGFLPDNCFENTCKIQATHTIGDLLNTLFTLDRKLCHITLENLLGKMMEKARIVPYLTNHSLRATTVTVLSAKNIETRKIKAITGHKSNSSIESYCKRLTLNQFKQMSTALTSSINGEETPETSISCEQHPQRLYCIQQATKDYRWGDTRKPFPFPIV